MLFLWTCRYVREARKQRKKEKKNRSTSYLNSDAQTKESSPTCNMDSMSRQNICHRHAAAVIKLAKLSSIKSNRDDISKSSNVTCRQFTSTSLSKIESDLDRKIRITSSELDLISGMTNLKT